MGWSSLVRMWTFRLHAAGYAALGWREARVGLVLAWIAGIGRYWDHPTAGLAQQSGVGSVAYVFALSALLWLMLRPLGAHRRSYAALAAMVGLTSPLAWVYALPVERWTSVDTAIPLNLAFLAVVALWRVALFVRYLRVGCGLSRPGVLVCAALPLSVIVTALTMLNLEHAVLDLMGGLRREAPAERVIDETYRTVVTITILSWWTLLPLLLGYSALAWHARQPQPPQRESS